jgi:hypothetical protein
MHQPSAPALQMRQLPLAQNVSGGVAENMTRSSLPEHGKPVKGTKPTNSAALPPRSLQEVAQQGEPEPSCNLRSQAPSRAWS